MGVGDNIRASPRHILNFYTKLIASKKPFATMHFKGLFNVQFFKINYPFTLGAGLILPNKVINQSMISMMG